MRAWLSDFMTDAKSSEEAVRLIALSYYSLDGSTKMSVAGCCVLPLKSYCAFRRAGGDSRRLVSAQIA